MDQRERRARHHRPKLFKAAHVLAVKYGWTFQDVQRLSPNEINQFMELIEQDAIAERREYNKAKARRR